MKMDLLPIKQYVTSTLKEKLVRSRLINFDISLCQFFSEQDRSDCLNA